MPGESSSPHSRKIDPPAATPGSVCPTALPRLDRDRAGDSHPIDPAEKRVGADIRLDLSLHEAMESCLVLRLPEEHEASIAERTRR
jgi:hypothetical protein